VPDENGKKNTDEMKRGHCRESNRAEKMEPLLPVKLGNQKVYQNGS